MNSLAASAVNVILDLLFALAIGFAFIWLWGKIFK